MSWHHDYRPPSIALGGRALFLHILSTMELLVDIAELFVGNVGIYLSGGHILVTQKLLDASEVRSVGE